MIHTTYSSPNTLPPTRGYSHVVEVVGGRTIYVSGQVPLDASGALVGAGDLRVQVRQVFENIGAALRHAGANFGDLVKITIFLIDANGAPIVREIRDEYVDTTNPPASSLVEVRRLVSEDWLVEIEAIASVKS